jgi:hypothetical protein
VKLPPTDSRLRPDQRHLENGEYSKANAEKLRLETRQRMVYMPFFSLVCVCVFKNNTRLDEFLSLQPKKYFCRHERCRRMAGNQDGSKGTAVTRIKHSGTLEVIGRQEGRVNGMTVIIYLVNPLFHTYNRKLIIPPVVH